jgi:Heparinase II/III-like protein/Heparinase II/III N-terminus
VSDAPTLRDRIQELVELGPRGVLFRASWEAKWRTPFAALIERAPARLPSSASPARLDLARSLPFDAAGVAAAMEGRLDDSARARLNELATLGAEGRILAFGGWMADYGEPPEWFLNPVTGRKWSRAPHWSRALGEERRCGDVKLPWEIGRFPHAYRMGRAAAFDPGRAPALAASLAKQIESFYVQNPFGRGLHWSSGQETAFRLMAWLFAGSVFRREPAFLAVAPLIVVSLHASAVHIERHFGYTQFAVYNNHLLSEAFLLLLAGSLLPGAPEATRWREKGLSVLDEQAERQFYADGGYIQLSHNYERVALQDYLWATGLRRTRGESVPLSWLAAMARGVDFLYAHQNPANGRLPNYGANDGALPSPLTSCDFSDMRPTLQAASLAARGERLYPPGPWDEQAAWLVGPGSLDAPLRPRPRHSVSFEPTGFHVLRGHDQGTFLAFRCGTVRDRFSQIDMLHVDAWWRGENVLVDGGSYLYNGPARWHGHFAATESHNTVTVDGHDQMLHYRRFKNLYWTEARLLRFEDQAGWTVAEGEHYGFRRKPGGCVHRRAVLLVKAGLAVVVDQVSGVGRHAARLHWLGGLGPWRWEESQCRLSLGPEAAPFCVAMLDDSAAPLQGDVVEGRGAPPRGWLSRYYGEKVPVPSLAAERSGEVPLTFVSLLSSGAAHAKVTGGEWTVRSNAAAVRFRLVDGRFDGILVDDVAKTAA